MTNKIILGTVQFGLEYGINNGSGKPSQETVNSILDLSFENGITILDTAEAYGNAQEVIGNYHHASANKFKVITKFSAKRNDLPQDIESRVKQNIQLLKVSSLHSYMFHSYTDFELHFPRFKNQLVSLKKEGLVQKIGVSIYTNREFESLLERDDIDLIQLPFNLLDNQFQRGSLIQKAKDKGVEIHTRSVFLQGLFFKELQHLAESFSALKPYLNELKSISKEYSVSMNQMALNYAINQPNIDSVLIGVDLPEQLLNNLEAIKNKLPVEVIRRIDVIKVKEIEMLNPSNWSA
jgi:aryl-alcohol dehydrogenase-like predicted oxidoreductase